MIGHKEFGHRSRRSQAALSPPHTGKACLTNALGTGNKAEANRLAVPWIAEFQAAITKAAEIRRNPVLHDWIGRYACYHPGENPFAPEQRIITQNPALILPGTHTKPVESIIDKWTDKTKNGKKAREDMERGVKRFTEWLKLKNLPHDDMAQVTFENCRDYRNHLYTSDSNPDHFKMHSNQLKMLRALFSCAAAGTFSRRPGNQMGQLARCPRRSSERGIGRRARS